MAMSAVGRNPQRMSRIIIRVASPEAGPLPGSPASLYSNPKRGGNHRVTEGTEKPEERREIAAGVPPTITLYLPSSLLSSLCSL